MRHRNKTLFLDRDGVLVQNRRNYIRSWEDVAFLPRTFEAMRIAASSSYKVILVTNQSAVGRGIITLSEAEDINTRIVEKVQIQKGRVDGVYMCPHSPSDDCECRKPRPGLILRAAEEHSIDVANSVLIGDALTDLRAGWAAGVRRVILIESGRGKQQARLASQAERVRFPIYPDLLQAVRSALVATEKGKNTG